MVNYMVSYVTEAVGLVAPGTLELEGKSPVHLLVKEKEFKYGKGKEYIAFTDGGQNQFGKDVKYVKFFYFFEGTVKLKPNDTIHIDETFTALKPGLIINNPNRRLPKEQRKIFEKNDWKIIDAAQPAHNKPPPLCFSSVWLSMNILVLDPKTVCVEKSEVYQAEQLSKLGMEVIEVDFRDVYPFGGGLHCSTTDVYREGKCEDYFPKQ